jgi:hypothetical protein
MAGSVENPTFWDDPRVEFVVHCIQTFYSKHSPGPKFDKLFQTEATRQVMNRTFGLNFILFDL